MSQIYKIFAYSLKHLGINIIQTETLPKKVRCTGYNSRVKKDGIHAIYCGDGKWRELRVKNITVPDFIEKYFSLSECITADSFHLGEIIDP
jgi:hypothetical protein